MAMLRECEQCKKTAEFVVSLGEWWTFTPPRSWSALDFCSWDCLRQFAAAHPDASPLPKRR